MPKMSVEKVESTALVPFSLVRAAQVELWVPIVGFPGYDISNLGRIRSYYLEGGSLCALPQRIRALQVARGYQIVRLKSVIGSLKTVLVHLLVAQHFVRNPKSKPQVNHITGYKVDNRAWNLERMTRAENIAHAVANGLFRGKTKTRLGKIQISSLLGERNGGATYETLMGRYGLSWNGLHQLLMRHGVPKIRLAGGN